MSALKNFRHEKKQTAQGFANLLGISLSYWLKLEYEVKKPSRGIIEGILHHYPDADIMQICFGR